MCRVHLTQRSVQQRSKIARADCRPNGPRCSPGQVFRSFHVRIQGHHLQHNKTQASRVLAPSWRRLRTRARKRQQRPCRTTRLLADSDRRTARSTNLGVCREAPQIRRYRHGRRYSRDDGIRCRGRSSRGRIGRGRYRYLRTKLRIGGGEGRASLTVRHSCGGRVPGTGHSHRGGYRVDFGNRGRHCVGRGCS